MMYKRNKVFTLAYRAYRIASDMLVFDKDIFKLEAKLKRNGFPRDFIKITIGKVLYRYHVPNNMVDAVEAPKRKEIFISLPFFWSHQYHCKKEITTTNTTTSIRV